VGGKKFDIRLYMLVTSYSPLVAWLYRDGFCRFSNQRYTNDDIGNLHTHLTNVAIQKTAGDYDKAKGCKVRL
jgi:tubulin polyglutamylase TTLL9